MRRLSHLPVAAVVAVALLCTAAHAQIVPFILDGNAGLGLLPGNENPPAANGTPGSGGLGPGGISLDTATNMLSIDILWGSANGFTDLTGDVSVAHIHAPTANPAPAGFSDNASPSIFLHTLASFNNSASAGGLNQTITITAAEAADLLAGRSYINVHTQANGPGEIRGHLVAIPEPACCMLILLGAAGSLLWLRHR